MRTTRLVQTALATAAALALAAGGALAQSTPSTTGTTGSGTGGAGSTGSSGSSGSGMTSGSTGSGAYGARQGSPSSQKAVSRGDRRFLEKVSMSNRAEIELGRMAQQKAGDPQVKAYAERMVQDHTQASEEMSRIASAKGVTMPTELDRRHKRLADKLQGLNGTEFDRTYMKGMVDDHEETVEDLRKASKSADDPEIKQLAAKMLPTMQQHHQMAKSMHDGMESAKR